MRRAFRESGLTMYRVAKDSGVDRAQVVRFFSGNRGLTLDAASRICNVLGLELRPVRRPKGKGR
jgi:plasmid maintenance system antidote protein VapI